MCSRSLSDQQCYWRLVCQTVDVNILEKIPWKQICTVLVWEYERYWESIESKDTDFKHILQHLTAHNNKGANNVWVKILLVPYLAKDHWKLNVLDKTPTSWKQICIPLIWQRPKLTVKTPLLITTGRRPLYYTKGWVPKPQYRCDHQESHHHGRCPWKTWKLRLYQTGYRCDSLGKKKTLASFTHSLFVLILVSVWFQTPNECNGKLVKRIMA